MDDELPLLPGAPESEEGEEPAAPPLPSLPPEISSGDDELRRLVAAGASTPEELRELAARIREHRDHEDEVWRSEVRPALKQARKGRLRLSDLVDRKVSAPTTNGLIYLFVIAGLTVALVLAAARSSVLWVLLPLVVVLAYAYRQGRREAAVDDAPSAAEDASD